MMLDMVITGVILAGAGVWAGRRLWRAARPAATTAGRSACGGGCSGCPVGDVQQGQGCSEPGRREG